VARTLRPWTKGRNGQWNLGSADWCALTGGDTRSVRGYRAENAYETVVADTVILLSSNPDVPCYRCFSKPSLADLKQFITENKWLYDLYLFAPNCRWTLVLVHEEELGALFATDAAQDLPGAT
jgi:hypothetical protein